MGRTVTAGVFDRSQQAASAVRRVLDGRRLIVAANREPYSHIRVRGRVELRHNAGGLVTALDPVLSAVGGSWVAWGSGDADFQVTDDHQRVRIAVDHEPGYALRRILLSEHEVADYYNGFANGVLWPLCHLELGRVRFERQQWECYRAVNHRFAQAIVEEVGTDAATVWLHDYHLALAAGSLRELGLQQSIHLFWHIPFPGADTIRTLPVRRELLEGMLHCDVIGFHVQRYVEAFFACVQQELPEARRYGQSIEYRGRMTTVAAIPISIDAAGLAERAGTPATEEATRRLVQGLHLNGQRVLLGLDRVDYTKGIPHRLEAYDRLLQRWPELKGRVAFIQKVDVGRQGIADYRELAAAVREQVAAINRVHGRPGWQPVQLLTLPLSSAEMAALYRLADVMVVSPVQDGMNLVAKEFVACQAPEHAGVLVLSELCGAAEDLAPQTLLINPYDADGFAEQMAAALEMPYQQRRQRLRALQHQIGHWDVFDWLMGALRLDSGVGALV